MRLTALIILAILTAVFYCGCRQEIDDADGELLVRELWKAFAEKNMDFLENFLDQSYLSIHQDGSRDRAAELELLKNLNLGEYELTEFIVKKNAKTIVVTYSVEATEMIDNIQYHKKSPRLSVFNKTPEGWKWVSHANLLPMLTPAQDRVDSPMEDEK